MTEPIKKVSLCSAHQEPVANCPMCLPYPKGFDDCPPYPKGFDEFQPYPIGCDEFQPIKKVTTCPKCHCYNPKSDHVCPEWATTPHHDKKPLKIEDHHNLPSVQIGNFSIKKGMQDNSKVWIGTEEGEGGDFPISLLEPVIAEFFNKYF